MVSIQRFLELICIQELGPGDKGLLIRRAWLIKEKIKH